MTRARALHDEFDRGFAEAPRPPAPAHRDFLCIRVAGEPSAIPLVDIASLHADLRVIALPSRAPELLGVTAIRATLVPIYDLGVAFGGSPAGVTRWTVLVRGGSAGFAFEGYDGHVRIGDRAIARATQRGHVRGQIVVTGQPRSVVDLASVLAAIETRWDPHDTAKDQ
jgi:purine-binding chemotaxis protein CheW